MSDLIRTIEGKGKVFDSSTTIADVDARISEYQNYIGSSTLEGGHSRIPGLRRVELDILESSRAIPMGKTVTLHMHSGEKLDFFMSGMNARATGAIH